MMRRTLSTRAMLLAAAALCAASLGGAPAFADDLPPEISLTEKLLTGLGLVPPAPPEIDYRERAPLVVPPTGDVLPPPRDAAAMAQNPNWPKDHDVVARQKASAPGSLFDDTFTAHKTLTPAQMERGAKAGNKPSYGSGFRDTRTNDDNRLSLNQLDFFGWGNKKEDRLVFEGEPDRELLTQPPVGYQTPAPGAAYGSVAEREEEKEWNLPNIFDRTQKNK